MGELYLAAWPGAVGLGMLILVDGCLLHVSWGLSLIRKDAPVVASFVAGGRAEV